MNIDFTKVAPFLQHPLVLAGFALLLVAGLFRAFLKSDRLAPAPGEATGRILAAVARYGFILALAAMLLGFGLEFYKLKREETAALDPNAVFRAIVEGHRRERAGWEQSKAQYENELANLRQTVESVTARANKPDAPRGLKEALAGVQGSGDTGAVEAAMRAYAEGRVKDGAAANREAAEAYREIGALARWRDTGKALDAYRRATELDPAHVWGWIERGRLEMQGGSLAAAEKSFARAQDAAQASGSVRDEMVALNSLGDVRVAQGDLAGARAAYEAALGISERLAQGDPGNAEWQRDLSISHNKLGDVRVAQGDLAGARAAYEAALGIAERLAQDDPGNAAWQRDLVVSNVKLGDVRVAQGDLAGARAAYEAALGISERLAQGDPGNAEWQRDLSISHEKLGDVRVAQGDLAGARAAYEAALGISERLAQGDPGNAEWQRDLSVGHEKLGDVRVAQGDLARARTAYEASLRIRERLAQGDPGNAAWQRDLFVSGFKLGDLHARLPDGRGAALEHFRRALDIVRAQTAAERWAPKDAKWEGILAKRIADLEQARAEAR